MKGKKRNQPPCIALVTPQAPATLSMLSIPAIIGSTTYHTSLLH